MEIREKLSLLSNYNDVYTKLWETEELLGFWDDVREFFGESLDKGDDKKVEHALKEIEVIGLILTRVTSDEIKEEVSKERAKHIKTVNEVATKYLDLYNGK